MSVYKHTGAYALNALKRPQIGARAAGTVFEGARSASPGQRDATEEALDQLVQDSEQAAQKAVKAVRDIRRTARAAVGKQTERGAKTGKGIQVRRRSPSAYRTRRVGRTITRAPRVGARAAARVGRSLAQLAVRLTMSVTRLVTAAVGAIAAGPYVLLALGAVLVAVVGVVVAPTWIANTSEGGDDAITAPASATAVTSEAATYLGAPYDWGGESHSGVDCSGLVKMAFKKSGVEMNHLADWQSRHGESVPLDQVRPGDVVGFRAPGHASFGHVGIYVGNDTFIHAPTFGVPVQYAKFSSFSRGYAEVVARRYIKDTDAAPPPSN
ncbi:MAG: NlpC/P60 family protein [Haemophilus parainfluenzae]|nr:NlpC/P60 family protein [Haemophilus parainfluenzae]